VSGGATMQAVMPESASSPQINVSKITGSGGVAGALFAVISMVIFLIGIPLLRYMFPAAVVLGGAVALIRRFMRRETPAASWILPAKTNCLVGETCGVTDTFEC